MLPFPEGRANELRFSTTGRLLIAAGGRGAYRGLAVVWDVTTGARVAEVGDEPDALLSADLSPDQSMIAVGTTAKRAKVFSTATGEPLYSVEAPTDWATAVAFSPDGVLLAVGDRAGNLGLWEAAGGLPYADLKGHRDAITGLAWRADSNLLASSSLDDTLHLWKPEDGSVAKKWNAGAGGVEAVTFAVDGRLATAGRSGEVALWDAAGKRLAAFPKRPDYALSVALAPAGERRACFGRRLDRDRDGVGERRCGGRPAAARRSNRGPRMRRPGWPTPRPGGPPRSGALPIPGTFSDRPAGAAPPATFFAAPRCGAGRRGYA